MRQKVSHQNIVEALQASAHEYGVELLAEKIRKAKSTLYAELNPYQYLDRDETGRAPHKLGLQDAMNIMAITGDYEPLHLMCTACGFTMNRLGCEPVVAIVAYQGLSEVMTEVGELAKVLQSGLADGHLSHPERVEIARQAKDITHALAPFLAVG